MARRTKREIMNGVDCINSHLVDHNTVEYERENGERVIRLHLTDIVTFKPNGRIVLNTGGWKTVTTRDRINKQLEAHCPGWHVWNEKNEMYLGHGWWSDENRTTYHFNDGITIYGNHVTCDGRVYDKEQVKLAAKHNRKVKKYAKDFIDALTNGDVPAPGGGDCWFCCFVGEDGKSWGEMGEHHDHIYHHIVEKYYVPSLLMRAIALHPVSPAAEQVLAYLWNNPQNLDLPDFYRGIGSDQLQKSLYRYCLHYAPYREGVMEAIIEENEAEVA